MEFQRDGAELFAGVLAEADVADLENSLAALPRERPGVRVASLAAIGPMLEASGQIGRIAAKYLGSQSKPVRAILFDKTEATNWALGWHQDRTIAVRERADVPGYGPWGHKGGIPHVEPPIEMLEAMVTLRVHLDDVDGDNAPLLVSAGSHRLGRIPEADIDARVKQCGIKACLAERGDIWAYSTLILHASEPARRPRRRRVLQLDYSAATLPTPLQFRGV
jgi:hypothetical protein